MWSGSPPHGGDRHHHWAAPNSTPQSRNALKTQNSASRSTSPLTQSMSKIILSARRKACDACVRAKRRCDLRTPCKRCVVKNLECIYQKSVAPTEIAPTSGLEKAMSTWWMIMTSILRPIFSSQTPGSIGYFRCSQGPKSTDRPIDFRSRKCKPSCLFHTSNDTWYGRYPTKHVSSKHLGSGTRLYGTRQLREYPEMLVTKSRTGFIHHRLYHDNLPPVIQDVFGVSALYYSPKTTNYDSTTWHIMDANVSDHLARVQALILIQIIRLFDGDIRQRCLAEEHEPILARWTRELDDRPACDDERPQAWEQWISEKV